ncbi:MAG: hypothetical protein DRJ33_01235 [Candidatus Methanomethylicota archaeon]|uniref:Radical SAM core domain-containing protein n=1 Tax=Thermoproteota archaeon TaxID=2056631 RepID=A0A497F213_9CREN|nr:MAG: hypothetical protein DRJ33_01235 [Candidatus Verstraetearchaeota archaeon]
MTRRTIYGPVPSWRFGRSLGIDVIVAPKTCSFDCIYCQLGKTINKIAEPSPNLCIDENDVLRDLEDYLLQIDLKSIDVITFSGCGEPTLNLNLKAIAKAIRKELPDFPFVILTNSSTLNIDSVRDALQEFDIVCVKLDAASDELFRRINRPANDVPSINGVLEGIKRFKEEFSGELRVQSMFLKTTYNFSNMNEEELSKLIEAVADIDPDVVQLCTPYRPASENFVMQASPGELIAICKKFRNYFARSRIWVFGLHDKRDVIVKWRDKSALEQKALSLLRRRPCRIVDISNALGINYSKAKFIADLLVEKGFAEMKFSNGEMFLRVKLPIC